MLIARHALALLGVALAVCACGGDEPHNDKTAGGQTGGENSASPSGCDWSKAKEISLTTPGELGMTPEAALAKFGAEYVAPGTITSVGATTFRVSSSYAGHARSGCGLLFIDVLFQVRTDDGTFDETLPAKLTVSALERAEVSGSLPASQLHGSYATTRTASNADTLSFKLLYAPQSKPQGTITKNASTKTTSTIAEF